MKKRYTVDEILSSKKKREETGTSEQSSKLQHLKIGDPDSKIIQANKIIQGIQDQDAEEEKVQNMLPKTNKEIYDFVVRELKNDGHKVNKENIDYLTEVVKSALANPESEEDIPMPGYVFVNPYTNKSA
jgi:DNA-directed RNA polymerase subunit F